MDDDKLPRLGILLIFVVLLGWMAAYQYLYPSRPAQPAQQEETTGAGKAEADTPGEPASAPLQTPDAGMATPGMATHGSAVPFTPATPAREIKIHTPLYEATLSTQGARLTSLQLTHYKDDEGKDPYEMIKGIFETAPGAGVLVLDNQEVADSGLSFTSGAPDDITIPADGEANLELRWAGSPGIEWVKHFHFTGDNYDVNVSHSLRSIGLAEQEAHLRLAAHLNPPPPVDAGGRTIHTEALLSSQGKLHKQTLEKLHEDKENLSSDPLDGWAGVSLHYFLFAWVPESAALSKAQVSAPSEKSLQLTIDLPTRRIGQNKSIEEGISIFLGPKDRDRIEAFGHGLIAAVNLGFFNSIARALLWVLVKIQKFIPDWGWAIIILTVLVRMLMFPLSVWQFKSMRAMQHIQPLMKEIREKYKGDPQRQQQEMMNLYRQYNVNPFGGCLPMLAQIPIFLGLYMALDSALELRQSPWGGTWIHDLSLKDPFYILPVLMTASTYLSMRLSPNPSGDETQKKLMQFMPLLFLFFFLNMPAGLMLYWSVSNILSIGQQLYINRAAKAAEGVKHPTMSPEPQPVGAGNGSPESDPESAASRRRRRRRK